MVLQTQIFHTLATSSGSVTMKYLSFECFQLYSHLHLVIHSGCIQQLRLYQ